MSGSRCFEAQALKGEPGCSRKAPCDQTARLPSRIGGFPGWVWRDRARGCASLGCSPCAVQWCGSACPCCSTGHPGSMHLALGSFHISMQWWDWLSCRVQAAAVRAGQALCQPTAPCSASHSHVGPRCPSWTLPSSTLAAPRVPEAGTPRSRDTQQGRCWHQRRQQTVTPWCCIAASHQEPHLACGARCRKRGGVTSTWTAAALTAAHEPLSAVRGTGAAKERRTGRGQLCWQHPMASSATARELPGSSTRAWSRSWGCPFSQWLCFVP